MVSQAPLLSAPSSDTGKLPPPPVSRDLTNPILSTERRFYEDLSYAFDKHIVGQQEAKQAIIASLLNGIFNPFREQGMMGAVFLGGPTGVGKTELARTLARVLFGNPNGFVKIEGEMMPHPMNVEKLTGSPAGYVGYGDTPWLADERVHAAYKTALANNTLHPLLKQHNLQNTAIVLVDEIEKAHPDVANAFLNMINAGYIQMSTGKEMAKSRNSENIRFSSTTDLRNTIIIFTSNVGEHALAREKGNAIGFTSANSSSSDKTTFMNAVKQSFAPEFIGRMDRVIRCHALDDGQMEEIFRLNIAQLNDALRKGPYAHLRVDVTKEFVEHILSNRLSAEYGARALNSQIKKVQSQVGIAIHSGYIPPATSGTISFDIENGVPAIGFRSSGLESSAQPDKIAKNTIDNLARDSRLLVESRIARYSDKVRAAVISYQSLVGQYDSGLKKHCKRLERVLRGYGFNSDDLRDLRTATFIELYNDPDIPLERGNIIIHEGAQFGEIGFRGIEKYLRFAVKNDFPLTRIYNTLYFLLGGPLTHNEGIIVAQLHHNLYISFHQSRKKTEPENT